MFTSENGNIDEQIDRWLSSARQTQDEALSGFCPIPVRKTINAKKFSELKITQEQFNNLRRITRDHSKYNILSWGDGKWKVYSSSLYNDLDSGDADPDDISCLAITHLSKEIKFSGDSDGTINEIGIVIEGADQGEE